MNIEEQWWYLQLFWKRMVFEDSCFVYFGIFKGINRCSCWNSKMSCECTWCLFRLSHRYTSMYVISWRSGTYSQSWQTLNLSALHNRAHASNVYVLRTLIEFVYGEWVKQVVGHFSPRWTDPKPAWAHVSVLRLEIPTQRQRETIVACGRSSI